MFTLVNIRSASPSFDGQFSAGVNTTEQRNGQFDECVLAGKTSFGGVHFSALMVRGHDAAEDRQGLDQAVLIGCIGEFGRARVHVGVQLPKQRKRPAIPS